MRNMADQVQEHDKKVLHSMGYAQELARRMSLFSNFAISFSIICILAGGISAFPAAFNSAGAGGAFLIWLIGGALAMTVAFGMGQIGSSFPTAGGLYHWSSHLGGKAWGWATAWFNLVGLIAVVSSVDVLLYQVFFRDLFLATVLKVDVSGFGYWHQFFFVLIVLATQALLNHYGIKLTTRVTDLSGYLIFALTIVLIISLFAFSPVALDFSRLFRLENFTGDAGGGVVPFRTESLAFAFLLGLSYVCYTLTGYDASAHTSEETHDAQVNVPKGMWQAVFWSWSVGLIMVAAFVLVMPSVEEAGATGWGAFFYMWGASRMPFALSFILALGIVIVNYICALAGLTSMSRMMFAFARDGGLPASGFLSHVSTNHRTPTYAIWTGAFLALLSMVYAPYYLVLAVACAVFLYLSYAMPIAAGFLAEGKTWKEKGPFNLGVWSKPNAIVAVLGSIVLSITGFFPPNEKVFYLTVALVIIMPILWYGFVRNRFEGVPEGDKITQRQKMITEIEKKYGEAD
jgi:amino acid transporter